MHFSSSSPLVAAISWLLIFFHESIGTSLKFTARQFHSLPIHNDNSDTDAINVFVICNTLPRQNLGTGCLLSHDGTHLKFCMTKILTGQIKAFANREL